MDINLRKTMNEVVDVISKIYYNLNGIINNTNLAGGLIMSYCYNPNSSEPGTKLATTNGFVVKIYPLNIITAYPEPILPAIFTVLHELSHMDQNIDFSKYNTDSSYVEDIETSNNRNTYEFILNNKDLISSILNNKVDIDEKKLSEIAGISLTSNNKPYEKISMAQIYYRAFDYLCYRWDHGIKRDPLIPYISFMNNDTIVFKIKDTDAVTSTLYIKKNGTFYNTYAFNVIMYYYIYQYNMLNYSLNVSYKYDKMEIQLTIKKKEVRPFIS